MKLHFTLLLPFTVSLAMAGERTSANYSIIAEIADSGGQRIVSANYTNDGSAAAIGGASTVAAPPQTTKAGYIGQVYDITGLVLNSAQPSVNEGDSVQLGAWQLLDDATFLTVDANAVTWGTAAAPIASVSASGLATAQIVYQDTPASVEGSFGGFSGALNLTVLNVNTDDFGLYAGDGIADDWQVQYFGFDNPEAAPGFDPDGDGQNNLLEFRAGYAPNDPVSLFTTHGMSVGGGVFTMELSRVQPGTRYIFERTVDFQTWTDVFTLDPVAVEEPFEQPLAAPDPNSFFRVRLKTP
jgi:hypothetical protein